MTPVGESAPVKPRGNGAVFGGSDSGLKGRPFAIDATLSLLNAYDDDLSEGQAVSGPVSGQFSDLSGGFSLSRKSHHSWVGARAATSMRYYPSFHRFVASTHSASADMNITLTRRTTIEASVDGTYVSEFAFDTITRQPDVSNVSLSSAGLDAAGLDGARISYGAAAGVSRKVGVRSSLHLAVSSRDSERRLINEIASERGVGLNFSHAFGRDTSIGVGYSVHSSSHQFGATTHPVWSTDGQVGLERRWRHAGNKQTVVNLSVGPALVQSSRALVVPGEGVASVTSASSNDSQLTYVGSIAINHDMSRSWNLGTSYRRGAGSIDGVVSDSANFDLRGLLSHRVEVWLAGGFLQTDLVLAGTRNRFTTKYGSSRLQIGLTRALAVYAQYALFDYSLGSATPLGTGLIPQQQRRGVRGGLTLWMPLHEGR